MRHEGGDWLRHCPRRCGFRARVQLVDSSNPCLGEEFIQLLAKLRRQVCLARRLGFCDESRSGPCDQSVRERQFERWRGAPFFGRHRVGVK